MGTLEVVAGAQFGSEAKGHVTAQLVRRWLNTDPAHDVHVIRVAGPNAGHTAYDQNGTAHALRTVPCAAVVDPNVFCYIAAGSEIDPVVLWNEIEILKSHGIDMRDRLFIDSQATVLTASHHQTEHDANLTANVGSTGKGIGAARADRLMRTAPIINHVKDQLHPAVKVVDNIDMRYERALRRGDHVIVEGTQGYGLGLHAGHYPHCTSSDCRAIDFLAMAGLIPWRPSVESFHVWLVARTYPIRVAGNSGYLPYELDWSDLAEKTGGYIQPERTTVTKKIRRVAEFDPDLVFQAVYANGGLPTVKLALTFADYLDPTCAGVTTLPEIPEQIWQWQDDWLPFQASFIGTGPNSGVFND